MMATACDSTPGEYDAFARFYDAFTAGSDYEAWTGHVLELAGRLGLRGRTLLDLACGTGKSFMPFLARGFDVTGCDVSRAMLAEAARKAPGARLMQADVRELGSVGQFDLVTCFDDSLNYLLEEPDLALALESIARNLGPDGIALFDLNTLLAYRTTFATDHVAVRDGALFAWRGRSADDGAPGCLAAAQIEVFAPCDDGLYERVATNHAQRHFPRERVTALLAGAGLECLGVFGVRDDGSLESELAEPRHLKALYAARLASSRVHKPRLKRTTDAVRSAAGDIYILRPGADSDLVIEQPDEGTRALLAALDGTRSAGQLERDFGREKVRDALGALAEASLLEDASDDERLPARDRARYDRQLRYFSDLAAGETPVSEYQRRLRQARVVMLGVGGLGSWTSYALACCGVGELVLVDGDRVEESNFNRQILYREGDAGGLKAEVAAEALAAFDSACRLTVVPRWLEAEEAVREIVEGADLVVNGADWPAHDIERWVNSACFAAGVPSITMSHSPPVARVGPMYVPGRTGCFACQETGYRAAHPLYDELIEQRRGRPSQAATLGPVCAFVGGQIALEVVHQLTGLVSPVTLGTAFVYDLRTMEVTREAVPRLVECEVCGTG